MTTIAGMTARVGFRGADKSAPYLLRSCRFCDPSIAGRVHQIVREPLPDATEAIYQEPRLAGSRQLMRRSRVPNELRRHALFLECVIPHLGVAHRCAEVVLALNE